MNIDTNTLLQIIGELEVIKRLQATEIAILQKQVAGLTEVPTPIKQEVVNNDG